MCHNIYKRTARTPHHHLPRSIVEHSAVLPDCECLHDNIKDAAHCTISLSLTTKNIINIKCALGFCNEFPDYNTPDEELDAGPNYSIIHVSIYNYQGRCATYGVIPNGPSVCILCKENGDINNGLIKKSLFGKKKHLTKMSCYVGEFQKVQY